MRLPRRDEEPVRPVARPTVPRRLNVARAGGLLVGVELLGTVIGFASTVYFAQTLGATALGVFFLFEALLSTVATLADFGIRGAVEKRVSEGEDPGQFLAAGALLKLLMLGVLAAVVLVFRGPINAYVGAPVAGLLVVAVVLFELSALTIHVLRGELRTGQTAVLYLLRLLTYVVLAVVLLQFGYGVQALVYALIASYVVLLVGGLARLSTRPALPSRRHVRSVVDYAKFNGIWGLGGHVYNTMDLLVVGFFLTQADVAAYELAWRVTLMTGVVGGVVANTIFAQLSAWHATGETARIRTTVRDSMTASLFLVVPAVFGVAVLGEAILGVVFGAEYVVAAAAFTVLMGEKVVAAVNGVFDAAVRGVDRPDIGAGATAVSLTVNVALNFLLVPRYGLVGAAAATGLAMALNTVALGWFLNRVVPVALPLRDVAWLTAAGAAMGAVLLAVESAVPGESVLTLAGLVALGGVVYLLVVAASPSLRTKLRATIADVGG
jgi:O-antigen/teichoic acid export membrane protein